ncbi:MAG TPA: serine/threonine-protein kinase [Ktedonobacteraceae bacterium]|nr:serine/threonine-protein kinase [Ktedonobacteraceae bacterium]
MADRVGQRMGSYRLIQLLAHGGFGDVYLAEHMYLQIQAAIKVLHTQIEQEDIAPFRREASIVARLVHPHIVRVLEFAVEGSTPFLVMDYAPGGSLRKRHPKGIPLSLHTVTSYVTQVASALQYAHSQNVIHRDVKPENMLIGKQNEILLSDFGIALVAQSSRYQTQDMQELAGTVAYMAPEQMQYQAIPNSDQYSLAVVVYEWLTGTLPFHGSFTEIAVKHTLAAPPLLRDRIPGFPAEVEEVIMRALAKDPQYRFPSVTDFARALQEASASVAPESYTLPPSLSIPTAELSLQSPWETLPVSLELASTPASPQLNQQEQAEKLSRPTPVLANEQTDGPTSSIHTPELEQIAAPNTQALKGNVSRRKVLLSLAGAAVVVIAGGGLALFAYERAQQATQPQSTPIATSGTAFYTYHGHSDRVWSVAWSPGIKGASTNNGAASSFQQAHIVSGSGDRTVQTWDAFNGQNRYIYTGHRGPVYAVGWSPTDTYLASASYDRTVRVWNFQTGKQSYVYQGHKDWVWTLAWSPDGKRIASGSLDNTVQVWNALNGSHVLTYRGHSNIIHAVAWSPDGRYIASASADRTVQVWDAARGLQLYTYQPYATSVWGLAWSPDSQRLASAADNNTVQLWDALTGDHLFTYYGHTNFVYAVAWSPDGKRIASGSDDRTVQVWNTDGSNPFIYTGHTDSVHSVAWSPDGKWLASGSFDKTVQVWQAPSV